jgi:sigma-B regulation protein RsbU (phosphoserine phosphatase)
LAIVLHTRCAWVTEYVEETRRLRALALWVDGELLPPFDIPIEGTPCEKVIERATLIHYPANIRQFFPNSPRFQKLKAVSYMGIPLINSDAKIIGNLAVLDTRPMPQADRAQSIIKIFGARAAAELQRILSEADIRHSEEKYRRIVETTSDGFLMLDENLFITDVNDAFAWLVGYDSEEIIGKELLDFVSDDFRRFIQANREHLFEGHLREFAAEIVGRDGRKIPVVLYGNTLRGDHGEMLGFMIFIVDMSRHKRSLALAGRIQQALLPRRTPLIDGFDIAWRSVSCEEVGGDYFDFIRMPDCPEDAFNFVVGDVSGHGVDAALIMASARSLLRMRAAQCGTPEQILNEMNLHLSRDLQSIGIFMTLFFMRLMRATGTLQWIRAGHLPAVIYMPDDDRFMMLMGQGIALGVDSHFSYQANHTPLVPGQIVAVGTDGIIETRGTQGELYGPQRLQAVIRAQAAETAETIVGAVMEDLDKFAADLRREDDVTLLVLKVNDTFRRVSDWQI